MPHITGNAVGRCTRPRADGLPCQSRRVNWARVADVPAPQSCAQHLTDDERAHLESARHRWHADKNDALAVAPACWSWPIPVPRPLEEWAERCATRLPSQRALLVAVQRYTDFHAGRCAICGDADGCVEDYCRSTGLVRGQLCFSCTIRVEGVDRRGSVFTGYRTRPPTVILGHAERHFGRDRPDGADPEPWVIEVLGPQPSDPAQAAEYLAAVAGLAQSRQRHCAPTL